MKPPDLCSGSRQEERERAAKTRDSESAECQVEYTPRNRIHRGGQEQGKADTCDTEQQRVAAGSSRELRHGTAAGGSWKQRHGVLGSSGRNQQKVAARCGREQRKGAKRQEDWQAARLERRGRCPKVYIPSNWRLSLNRTNGAAMPLGMEQWGRAIMGRAKRGLYAGRHIKFGNKVSEDGGNR